MVDHAPLADAVQDWLTDRRGMRARLVELESPDLHLRRHAARTLSDSLAHAHTSPAPETVTIDELTVDVVAPGRRIRVRRYRPPGAGHALPTQIWLHGGGFLFGTVDEVVNDRLCATRAAATGVQILSVEYRLAPEHPYPAPVDDAIAVFDAAVSDPRLGTDPARIGIGGNSAGGTIAASAALRIRDTRQVPLIHQLLEAPQVTFEPFGPSALFDLEEGPRKAGSPRSDIDAMQALAKAYFGERDRDRYSVPLEADPVGLPVTLIMTAEYDPLRDGAEAYAERLRDASVSVEVIRGEGHMHGSLSLTARWDNARRWQSTAAAAMTMAYS